MALGGTLAPRGCTEAMMAGGRRKASETIASLRAKGFKPVARNSEGQIVAMSYTGPVTDVVVCGPRNGTRKPIAPRIKDLDGVEKLATLDAFLNFGEGDMKQGSFASVLRTKAGAPEGMDFSPGEVRSLASGLTCTSA
jgi:hypothetical protein